MKRLYFFVLTLVATLAHGQELTYLERCLGGVVQSRQCTTTIANFWRHNPQMLAAARATGLEPALIRAVAAVESRYNSQAKSPAGAAGVMQLMPGTGRMLGLDERGLYHPGANLYAGAQYLAQMHDLFDDWSLAIAAYNAGPGAVKKYGNRIPPYQETQNYVRSVFRFYALFKAAEVRAGEVDQEKIDVQVSTRELRSE